MNHVSETTTPLAVTLTLILRVMSRGISLPPGQLIDGYQSEEFLSSSDKFTTFPCYCQLPRAWKAIDPDKRGDSHFQYRGLKDEMLKPSSAILLKNLSGCAANIHHALSKLV